MGTSPPVDAADESGSQPEQNHPGEAAVTAAWPDLFANLQAAYAKVIDTQFELERRAAELEDSRDLLRQVIASMSEALFLLDRTGRVMQVNPAALALIGWTEADCLGQLFRKICPDPNAPISAWKILNKAAHGSLTGLETELRGSDGRPRPVSLSAAVVRNRNGRIDGVLIIAQDQQPQQQVQSQQAQQQRQAATAQFATKLAQKLVAPVEMMRGYSHHLRQISRPGAAIDEQWLADLQRLEEAADQMARLVAHLQAIGRPALGTFKPVNVNQLVEATLLLMAVPEHQAAIPVHCELEAGLPAVQGDWHELAYAAAGLLQTMQETLARQLTAIHVHTCLQERQICLCFTGHLATTLPEPDFVVPPLAQHVLARHGGQIRVEAEGQRLSLTLQLPGLVKEDSGGQ
jgi:PAS domain S-box-containing protein